MFVVDADKSSLRQGDILAGIPFPRLDLGSIVILGKITEVTSGPLPSILPVNTIHRDDPNWITAQVPVRISFAVVISQCCDLEPRHGRFRLPAFAVARLIPVPKAIAEDESKLASLRSNKDPRDLTEPGYINFFHIQSHEKLENREWVVDFNQTLSIPGSEFQTVLSNKLLQMDNGSRVRFKIKLGVSMARLTEEENKEGLGKMASVT
jgi:hypothetical protein